MCLKKSDVTPMLPQNGTSFIYRGTTIEVVKVLLLRGFRDLELTRAIFQRLLQCDDDIERNKIGGRPDEQIVMRVW